MRRRPLLLQSRTFPPTRGCRGKMTRLENTNNSAVVLVITDNSGPHLSQTALLHRTIIPMTSSVEVFPNTFLELQVFSSMDMSCISAHVFFESNSSYPESWTSFCPSLVMFCDKLTFGQDGRNVTVEGLKKSSELSQRLMMPFRIHNTQDIPGKPSLFSLSAYLKSASNLKEPDYFWSPDPFLARRGIKIAVGVEGKKLTLDIIREEKDKVEDEDENCWEELRLWQNINFKVLVIVRDFCERNDVEDGQVWEGGMLSEVRACLLQLYGFVGTPQQ